MSDSNTVPLNMNFHQTVCVLDTDYRWLESPAEGVSRMPLEKKAEESGHTTSIVRFAAGSSFPPHAHPLGEEIYVLDGVFSDENGDYPTGTYIRNPPNSSHTPFTREGCTLFVKLDQFAPDDLLPVVLLPEQQQWLPGHGNLKVLPLHEYETQHTAMVHWPASEVFNPHQHWGGEEIFVVSGEFCDEHGRYPAGSWLRSPHQSKHTPFVELETLILVKTGHLAID
jgi:anti-sigma factor ChrR (cupin superfamily)